MFGNFALLGLGVWGVVLAALTILQWLQDRQSLGTEKRLLWACYPPVSQAMREAIAPTTSKSLYHDSSWWYPVKTGHVPVTSLLSLVLIGCVVWGPLVLKIAAPPYPGDAQTCPAPLQGISLYVHPASAIHLHNRDGMFRTQLPNIYVEDFRAGLKNIRKSRYELSQALLRLKPGRTLIPVPQTGSRLLLLATQLMPKKAGHYMVCGQEEPFPSREGPEMNFFRVKSLKPQTANMAGLK
jgi:hypothetical protein